MSAERIIIEPANPYDFTRDELVALQAEIEAADPSLDVTLDIRDERGYGVSSHEVIRLVSEGIEEVSMAGGAISAFSMAGKLAKARWQKARDTNPTQTPRPRTVTLYDARGNPVKSIVIDEPDGEGRPDTDPPHHPTRGLDHD